jgi:DeoR/GlpR family transcriptional regulator of sugar metabolism
MSTENSSRMSAHPQLEDQQPSGPRVQAPSPRVQRKPAPMRRELILREANLRGFVTTADLAVSLGVSEMTLRRDLDFLVERGDLNRTHGGAVALEQPTRDALAAAASEPSLELRESVGHEAKLMIAAHALNLLGNARTVAVDIGSTTLALAERMTDLPLRVFTSSLRIASTLKQSRVEVYVPSGHIYGSEPSITGSSAVDFLRNQSFDVAFLGASGVTEAGLYDYSFQDSEIKRALIERSALKVLLIDDSKFNRTSATLIARLQAIDVVVTNAAMPVSLQEAFSAAGVRVEVAAPTNL